jgi:acetoacetyl-CoA synthetase
MAATGCLFVVLEPGVLLDDRLRSLVLGAIRRDASPRHVPDALIEVPAVPHTRTGKKLEIPVKRILQGVPSAQVTNRDSVDDFSVLEYFEQFAP